MTDVLVFAAFEPELAGLRAATTAAAARPLEPGRSSLIRRVAFHAVGVGLPTAAAGAATHLAHLAHEHLRPRTIILVGTCGAYPHSGLAVGEVIVAARVLLVEPCALPGMGALTELPVPPMNLALEGDQPLGRALALEGARAVDVATTLGVTVDDRAAAEIARATGAMAEHMEAYGVAAACAPQGVPFASVLGVANIVGAGARQQWRAHHGEAAAAAASVVFRWLEKASAAEG